MTIAAWRRTSSRVIATKRCCCRRACGSGGFFGDEVAAGQGAAADVAGPAAPDGQRAVGRGVLVGAPVHQHGAGDGASVGAVLLVEDSVEVERGAVLECGVGDHALDCSTVGMTLSTQRWVMRSGWSSAMR